MKIPKIVGVELVEWKHGFGFTPVMAPGTKTYRAVSLGRMKMDANLIGTDTPGIIKRVFGKPKCYVVVFWYSFSQGDDPDDLMYDFHVVLGPKTTAAEARQQFNDDAEWWLNEEKISEFEKLIEPPAKPMTFPKGDIEREDIYKARLKVLSPVSPRTAEIFFQSINVTDPAERDHLQREFVQAYLADTIKSLSNEEFNSWQSNNSFDKKLVPGMAASMKSPAKVIDAVDYELALNWIARRYNKMKPDELVEIIYKVTGERLTPVAIRKRHYRGLGLMTKRKAGAKPKM